MFNLSLLKVLDQAPWRYTTLPTYDGDGNEVTPGVKQTLNGVFVLLSPELVAFFKENLTQEEKDEIDTWVNNYTQEQLAEWHAPCWAGRSGATYLRIPAAVWDDPTTEPPLKVKRFFRELWEAATD